MVRERLYGLALAVPACAAIGGAAYPHLYAGPVVLYDPAVGYWCGAAVGVFPGLLGREVVIRGRGLGAVKGSVLGVMIVLATAAAVELTHQPFRGGWSVSINNMYDELPCRLLKFGALPAVTLGGVIGWNRFHDPRPDGDDDS